ncbi:hypothetical protein [Mycolicibacterium baixiangningiae]|uniref:hypothetical protein n=1 Tax=Mycolicibacterium baixiangningiae TaxID=2761578 RepID=UPI001868BC9D|nr:hypothetical protein [Mycolicibacterium baixiangningiae]
MKFIKAGTAAAVLIAAAATITPPANAMMTHGNYEVWTNRYTDASWVWFVTPCYPDKKPDCVDVSAIPRPKRGAYYDGFAHLVNGRYTLNVDVPDGLRCPGHVMPARETYEWDEVSLLGTITSAYNVGCFNGPPGTQFWTFKLQRL